MPFLKTPIHISYLLFLGKFSPFLARMYFRLAMILCRLTGTQPSLLLHPLDFLDRTDTPRLDFFPAMDVPADKKITLIEDVLGILGQYFKPVTLEDHAREISRQGEKLTLINPSFSEV